MYSRSVIIYFVAGISKWELHEWCCSVMATLMAKKSINILLFSIRLPVQILRLMCRSDGKLNFTIQQQMNEVVTKVWIHFFYKRVRWRLSACVHPFALDGVLCTFSMLHFTSSIFAVDYRRRFFINECLFEIHSSFSSFISNHIKKSWCWLRNVLHLDIGSSRCVWSRI